MGSRISPLLQTSNEQKLFIGMGDRGASKDRMYAF